MATGLAADLPDSVGDRIKKVDGIKSIDATRLGQRQGAGRRSDTDCSRSHSPRACPISMSSAATSRHCVSSFKNGEVAIGSVLAERAKLKVGDKIMLEIDKGRKKFPDRRDRQRLSKRRAHDPHGARRRAKDLGYEGVTPT